MLLRINNSLTVWGWYRICLLDFRFSLCLLQPDWFSFHFISICSVHRSQISLKSASIPLFPWIRYFTISLSLFIYNPVPFYHWITSSLKATCLFRSLPYNQKPLHFLLEREGERLRNTVACQHQQLAVSLIFFCNWDGWTREKLFWGHVHLSK